MAKFKKGHKGGPGRPKGAENRTTIEFREALNDVLEFSAPQIREWLMMVAAEDPAKALDLITKLAEYCYPKLARQEQIVKDGDKYEDLLEKVERERKEQPTVQ